MYQRWRSLLFFHYPCPPEEVYDLVPDGLDIDTFPDADGHEMAWIGFVPFRMEGVRPRGLPAAGPCSHFPETNVRTYVHQGGKAPGVWFFSLDAASPLACRLARRHFALPYFEAAMSVEEHGEERRYVGRRNAGTGAYDVHAAFGESLPDAEPGSLEFFLIERYLLYAHRRGRLYSGRVHHSPYPLRSVVSWSGRETLVAAAGLNPRRYVHQVASNGVDVEVFSLRMVA